MEQKYHLPILSSDKTAIPSDQTAQNISRIKLDCILMLKIPPLSIFSEYAITTAKKTQTLSLLYYLWCFREEKNFIA